jgi:hypothetical protein
MQEIIDACYDKLGLNIFIETIPQKEVNIKLIEEGKIIGCFNALLVIVL